jgi:hypothetical protein
MIRTSYAVHETLYLLSSERARMQTRNLPDARHAVADAP